MSLNLKLLPSLEINDCLSKLECNELISLVVTSLISAVGVVSTFVLLAINVLLSLGLSIFFVFTLISN